MVMSERWARWRQRLGLRHGLLLVAAVAAAGLAVTSYEIGALSALEGQTVDARFAIRGPEPAERNIVIVACLSELGAAARRPTRNLMHYLMEAASAR